MIECWMDGQQTIVQKYKGKNGSLLEKEVGFMIHEIQVYHD